jgi:hypothetical protein
VSTTKRNNTKSTGKSRAGSAGAALPGLEDHGPTRGGAVYRGVREQLAALRKSDPDRLEQLAGIAASAKQLGHSIDVASGRGGGKVETYALAQLHKELREHLALLAGADTGADDAEQLRALLEGGE